MSKGKRTNISGNPGKDDLALSCVTNGLSELGIIPGIDFAVSSDYGCSRVQVSDLLWQRPVWACFSTGGQNDRKIKKLGDCGVSNDVIPKLGGFVIPDLASVSWCHRKTSVVRIRRETIRPGDRQQ